MHPVHLLLRRLPVHGDRVVEQTGKGDK